MDIVDLIKDDHEEINEIMDRLQGTSADDTEERETLFHDLRNLLEAHTNAEERVVYQRVEDEESLNAIILESYEDHTLVTEMLQSLSELEFNDEDWAAKFEVLKENVEKHVNTEESQVLPEVQQLISDEDREEMADDMRSLEDEIISAGPGAVTQTPARSGIGTNL